MKQSPILFSTPMVCAILEDKKTVTRRLNGLERMNENPDNWKPYSGDFRIDKLGRLNQKFFNVNGFSDHAICPYGKPGDLLWVRETHDPHGCLGSVLYKADYSDEVLKNAVKGTFTWKPSIHMLKSNARIWLKIKDLKVERLQSITHEEAENEGIEKLFLQHIEDSNINGTYYKNYYKKVKADYWATPYHSFQSLWEQINGSDSWELNPWLWVVQFERTDKPQTI